MVSDLGIWCFWEDGIYAKCSLGFVWTIIMAFIEIPEMPVLHGEEAVEFLNQMIKEFQQQKGTRLTDKQAETLTKAANQMISIIRAETWAKSTGKLHSSNHLGLFKRFWDSQRSE